MSTAIAMTICFILGCSFGWCWGHHSRPQPRRVWACARCDDEALTEHERARFKAITRHFDQPDDPRSNAA